MLKMFNNNKNLYLSVNPSSPSAVSIQLRWVSDYGYQVKEGKGREVLAMVTDLGGGGSQRGLREGKYLWCGHNICIAETSSPPRVPLLASYLIGLPSISCISDHIFIAQELINSSRPEGKLWEKIVDNMKRGECICWCQIFWSDIEVGKAFGGWLPSFPCWILIRSPHFAHQSSRPTQPSAKK